jgi:rod shape determining protein RodA
MFAGMLAIGLLQNIHLRATASLPTRYARPISQVTRGYHRTRAGLTPQR